MSDRVIRTQLGDALGWADARVTFDRAVAGIPPRLRGIVPVGMPHSAWQLVEHIRLAQADIQSTKARSGPTTTGRSRRRHAHRVPGPAR